MQTNNLYISFSGATSNPNGYISIYNIDSATCSANPVDGHSYSVGDIIGDCIVASTGSTTNFTLSGISTGNIIKTKIYSYNGQNFNINYLTSSSLSASYTASLTSEPIDQPSNITFSNITSSSMIVSFSGITSNDGYLVQISTSSITSSPLDGIIYDNNDTIGNSIVVGSGTGSSYTLTGLTSNTTYYFKINSYNGISFQRNYNIINSLTGYQLTQDADSLYTLTLSGKPNSTYAPLLSSIYPPINDFDISFDISLPISTNLGVSGQTCCFTNLAGNELFGGLDQTSILLSPTGTNGTCFSVTNDSGSTLFKYNTTRISTTAYQNWRIVKSGYIYSWYKDNALLNSYTASTSSISLYGLYFMNFYSANLSSKQIKIKNMKGTFAWNPGNPGNEKLVLIPASTTSTTSSILNITGSAEAITSLLIDSSRKYIYFGTASTTATNRIVKIDLNSFTEVNSISLTGTESIGGRGYIDSNNQYAYFIQKNNSPSISIIKIDLSSFTIVSRLLTSVTSGSVYNLTPDINEQYLYTSFNDDTLYKINVSGNMTIDNSATGIVSGYNTIDENKNLITFAPHINNINVFDLNSFTSIKNFTSSETYSLSNGNESQHSIFVGTILSKIGIPEIDGDPFYASETLDLQYNSNLDFNVLNYTLSEPEIYNKYILTTFNFNNSHICSIYGNGLTGVQNNIYIDLISAGYSRYNNYTLTSVSAQLGGVGSTIFDNQHIYIGTMNSKIIKFKLYDKLISGTTSTFDFLETKKDNFELYHITNTAYWKATML